MSFSLETYLTVGFILIPLVIIALLLRPVFKRFDAIEKEVDKELGLKDRYYSYEDLKREMERLRRLNIVDKDYSLNEDKGKNEPDEIDKDY